MNSPANYLSAVDVFDQVKVKILAAHGGGAIRDVSTPNLIGRCRGIAGGRCAFRYNPCTATMR